MPDKENEPDEIISLDAVKEFLIKHNGKVRQEDLINNFRHQLSSPSTKVRARQEFKDILQLITAVKTENREKWIVLIKQQQEHFQTSVINRKANRPLSARKELAKSKIGSDQFAELDQEDYVSGQSVSSTGADAGMSESTSSQSVSSLKSALSDKLKNSQSIDSIHTYMADGEDDDLEDDIGLNEGSVVLPEEKDWMLASAHGNIERLKNLLKKYPELSKKKDFVMTALHWAAKLGRADIVKFIASTGVDIHSKSGYTPLHIAALSGKDHVITQLIELHGANIHARDHSGKKPKDVVRDTVSADVQRKLGRSLVLVPNVSFQPVRYHANLSPPVSRHQKLSHSSNPSSDGELSPLSTPVVARKHLKSIGASAQRSMSFLMKKKKDTISPRLTRSDIQHSPQPEQRNSELEQETVPWKKEIALKKEQKRVKKSSTMERPKSQIIHSPTKDKAFNYGSVVSFEI